MGRRAAQFAAVALLGTALAACGGSSKTSSSTGTTVSQGSCAQVKTPKARTENRFPPTRPLDGTKTWKARIETTCGPFTVELDVKASPKTTASFVALARSGFYDRTIFHRVVPGFVIQGGDPTQSGGGSPGYTVVDKPPPGETYPAGTVAMAKTQAEPSGTSGSQFFVVTGADAGLTPDYALLGKVVSGMNVVFTIDGLGDPATPLPSQTVVVRRVVVSSS